MNIRTYELKTSLSEIIAHMPDIDIVCTRIERVEEFSDDGDGEGSYEVSETLVVEYQVLDGATGAQHVFTGLVPLIKYLTSQIAAAIYDFQKKFSEVSETPDNYIPDVMDD
jgi:hypothetical protein